MRKIPFYQVDAFTLKPFRGNPAAVCIIEEWLPDRIMQLIARENNLSETAFALERREGFYELRWFTPLVEVDLCGHATLATAFVIYRELRPGYDGPIEFSTRSGILTVFKDHDVIYMDFPSRKGTPAEKIPLLERALGSEPAEVYRSRDLLVVFDDPDEVIKMKPDFAELQKLNDVLGVIVTAPHYEYDFVSRFFAPRAGVPEDPVTGSAHCTLIPYWSARLGKKSLRAYQASERGGEVICEDRGERVLIGGHGVLYAAGTIFVDDEEAEIG
ncbi:PhzF family phenazine biosynthesis protein [Thermodesulforhabdus norvegica]|uniref:Phenazine biosynthesis protein PhzF family n=1 Tax=Thermodesulforhabdus norvegica TaxID=39841 RepID=A0A1I4W603_9BACT|nr:PhzF family phenazine biosynthesis protein [Thermodesulforhabdus norvegica]SFN08807.1 phenazine biosynthesis protein PhzF family [Thermodesulforhabdus norvegica]